MKGKKVLVVSKFARRIPFLVLLVALCTSQDCVGNSPTSPPTQIAPAVTATGTDKITPTATTTPQPTSTETVSLENITDSPSTETPNAAEPEQVSVYYISDNQLYFQQLGEQPQALLVLPDLGAVKDALKVEENIFIIRERGLQRVSITNRSVDLVEQFPNATISGYLLAGLNQEILSYAVDDKVKFYDLRTGKTSEVFSQSGDLSQPNFFVPLGLSAEGTKLYLVPRGGDPEFPDVWELDLDSGVVKPFPIGIGSEAALSPHSRYLAIASTHFIELEQRLEYKLSLFDLASAQPLGQVLSLPDSPSHSYGKMIWSPDSQKVYFLLRPGAPYEDPTTSYGLWRFEVESETFSQVVNLDDPYLHFISLSPDGEWALLMPEPKPAITLVRIESGEIETIEVLTPQFQFALVRYQVIPK